MDLSYRLNKISQKVNENGIIADIGTDHAYIPIFLYKNNKITKGIACDISKGPLKNANENIARYNLQDKIETRLSDGLSKITLDDKVDTIIISGMGGMLIIDILENGKEIVQNAKELILQPQKSVNRVRNYLHKIGFKIEEDEMIKEDNRFYSIIRAVKGNEEIAYTKEEYLFGKFDINKKSVILKEYIEEELYKMNIILKKLKNINVEERILEIENNIKTYMEVLKCL